MRGDDAAAGAGALLHRTRRHFFRECGIGLGTMALTSLQGTSRISAATTVSTRTANPLAPQPSHFPGRAQSVIYLFMAGAPSQLELFDYKPALQKYSNQEIPDSFIKGRRFAFMDTFTKQKPKLLGTTRKFAQHGEAG